MPRQQRRVGMSLIRRPRQTGGGAPATGYDTVVKADTPDVYWRLGETAGTAAADASGNNRPGTYQNNYTLGQTGLLGGDPTAKSVFVQFSQNSRIVGTYCVTFSAFTLEAWFKWTGTTGFVVGLAGSTASQDMFYIAMNSNLPELYVRKSSWMEAITSTVGLPTNTVGHVAATYDGTTMRLYLNGTQTKSDGTLVSGPIGARAGAVFCAGGTPAGGGLTGYIQDVAVYPTALSAARILAHYNAGK